MKTFAPELSALMIILRSTGPGDLDAAVERGPCGSGATVHSPSRIVGGLGQEVGPLAGVEARLPLAPAREQLQPPRPERPHQVGDEGQRASVVSTVSVPIGPPLGLRTSLSAVGCWHSPCVKI